MPGTKRKASTASPYDRPSKLAKRSTSAGIGRQSSSASLSKRASATFPPPSKRSSVKSSPSGSSDGVGTPPSLRRASTLNLNDSGDKSTLSKKRSTSSSSSLKPSLSRKASSVVVEEGTVTTLDKLRSGSIVGKSLLSSCPSLPKSLSKKASLAKSSSGKSTASSKGPAVPSGLTKLALSKSGSKASLSVSKSALMAPVGDSEMAAALASLRDETSVGSAGGSAQAEDVAPPPPDMPQPPGGLVEVAISFDTTGSMYGCLTEVRAKVQDLIQRLQADIPGIRIAIIAHGDYCDVDKYIIQWIDFGASLPEILDFVNNVDSTFGGDGPECYELVLLRAKEALTWTPGSQRVLVVIGDDEPHPVGYTYAGVRYDIDWKKEAKDLANQGTRVYGVQAGNNNGCAKFFNELAKLTGGKRLTLKDFSSIFDMLMMICYREGNPDMIPVYEAEVRGRRMGGMAKDMEDLLVTFGAPSSAAKTPKAAKKKTTAKAAVKKKPAKPKAATVKAAGKAKGTKLSKVIKTAAKKGGAKKAAGAKKPLLKSTKTAKRTLKKRAPKKLQRESVPDTKLEVKRLKWTPWLLAVSKDFPKGFSYKNWTRSSFFVGYRKKQIFDNTSVYGVYEVAVQLPGRRKRYVMYYHTTRGCRYRGSWECYLLRDRVVREEIRAAVGTESCKLFVRRGVISSKSKDTARQKLAEIDRYLAKNFDYAWRKRRGGKKTHRRVVRNKVILSGFPV